MLFYLSLPLSLVSFLVLTRYAHASTCTYTKYSTVTGLFAQDDNSTNPSTFSFLTTNFGLLNQTYPTDRLADPSHRLTQWQRFTIYVTSLNLLSGSNVDYKLLYMGRHGEGYHNAAQTYYGTPAWNCYWSEKDGNATVVWADAHLTATGTQQAQTVNTFWKQEITQQKIPTPESYYTSPLTRCLATANVTFSGLGLPKAHPFVPTVKELFREGISGHTCDRRSSKTYIHQNFPSYRIEAGFAEEDPLWEALHGETNGDQDVRSKTVLDDVFAHDRSTYISITSHSGEIASILRVLRHRPFSLSTGAVIPVLVKVETVRGDAPSTTSVPYTSLATCAAAPTITADSCDDCSCCS